MLSSSSLSVTTPSVAAVAVTPVSREANSQSKEKTPKEIKSPTSADIRALQTSEGKLTIVDDMVIEEKPSIPDLMKKQGASMTAAMEAAGLTTIIKEAKPISAVEPSPIPPPVPEKQRAIVKPHILTHFIEGFVIKEGLEPFPVCDWVLAEV